MMFPYETIKLPENPDLIDVSEFGMKSSAGKLNKRKRGSNISSNARKISRRLYKRKDKMRAMKILKKEILCEIW